ncbi:DNA-directed RNA polymerase II subunit RPB7-like [Spinacia oleracea]|uniref:DNA-directed RNA polymerase subunit n=1 Tax=Spinacia oleracea TaxID=3562 RepID=A0ABM3R067_SPIOL|nr:DNA-directed RNA polymerase II subunit RPB7-like [Spinacia oleracea]
MYFHIVLEKTIEIESRHFGHRFRDNIISKLIIDVEGTCSERHGFVVAVTGIEDIGKGLGCVWALIRDNGTAFVTFPVKFKCLVFRPFKGEIVEAVITMVNRMGFFTEVSPVQVFVSNHLIPDDMEFQSIDTPTYSTSDGLVKIQKDTEVRLKIIGTRVDTEEIFCIGAMKEDYMGVR